MSAMNPAQKKAVNAAISQALKGRPKVRRSPLQVTVDRLRDHYEEVADKMTGAERDELSRTAHVLEQIAEGERD